MLNISCFCRHCSKLLFRPTWKQQRRSSGKFKNQEEQNCWFLAVHVNATHSYIWRDVHVKLLCSLRRRIRLTHKYKSAFRKQRRVLHSEYFHKMQEMEFVDRTLKSVDNTLPVPAYLVDIHLRMLRLLFFIILRIKMYFVKIFVDMYEIHKYWSS